MPNRLTFATSPYLLQHQHNPVDWYPWNAEAFAKAAEDDKPIFLSVGYSSCHWCHVMEHECFEDQEVADLLNAAFVSIKVDREERPDVDEAYMAAVQLATGRGGWPMSVFMTPDRKPFLAGTYFPKQGRQGAPGFMDLLASIQEAWARDRARIQEAADEFASVIAETLSRTAPQTFGKLDPGSVAQVVGVLASEFDREHAGFGGAPKFPPHTSIEFLLDFALDDLQDQKMRDAAVSMAFATLKQMALGGIHDHVGGGFHRYSVDAQWLVPHFEKMLYDNALLLAAYSRAASVAAAMHAPHEGLFRRTAAGIVDWLARNLTSDIGAFYSALDADSEGEEGKFYVWSTEEVRALLGEAAGAFLNHYRFQEEGNFHEESTDHKTGLNIPHLVEDDAGRFAAELATLREARAARVRPGLDDKCLASWNGLAVGALALAGEHEIALRAAKAVLASAQDSGELPHQIAKGLASGPAFLDDYACFAWGLLRLQEALESDGRAEDASALQAEAERLVCRMIDLFYDEAKGGFFFTAAGHEELFARTKPVFDQPIPSPNALAIRCLMDTGDLRRAKESLATFYGWMERAPQATEALWSQGLRYLRLAPLEAEAGSAVDAPIGNIHVQLPQRELPVDPDGWARGVVLISIPDGMHLNTSNPAAKWLQPTRVEVRPLPAEIDYPPSAADRYSGELEIPFRVRMPDGQGEAEFEVIVGYQACTETECQAPKEAAFAAVALRS